jgi:SAM-dependent methyltransferase
MHQDALTHINLYCTACRTYECGVVQHPLRLVPENMQGNYVLTGRLECTNCQKRYPIVDGVPVMVQSSSNNDENTARYLDAHYGNINTGYWREMNSVRPTGLSLDTGCSTGRYTFECAQRGFAIGLDINLEHLILAATFQRTGKITYQRKTRSLKAQKENPDFRPAKNVLFILADIHNPPFKMNTFDFISALNVVDSVKHPLTALGQINAMLKPQGTLILSSPYVWDSRTSEEWLETVETGPHEFVIKLLTGKMVPECEFDYRLIEQRENIPWNLRQQDTLHFTYLVDKIVARKNR